VIRHHRLLETYLVTALGIPWYRAHEEAERLEHVISEYLEDRIDALLGHPLVDPHGSPIPGVDGTVRESERLRLADVPAGVTVEIVEVGDRQPGLLQHLDELGLRPGARIDVLGIEPIDGIVRLRAGETEHVLGSTSARHIIVRLVTS